MVFWQHILYYSVLIFTRDIFIRTETWYKFNIIRTYLFNKGIQLPKKDLYRFFFLSKSIVFFFHSFNVWYLYIFWTRLTSACPRLIVYWMRASTAEILQNANDEGSFYLTRSTQTFAVIATINYRRQTDVVFSKKDRN